MHRPQRHARIISRQNFLEGIPTHGLIARWKLGMRYHVVDGALGVAAKHCSCARRFGEQCINYGTVSESRLVQNLELPAANCEMRAAWRLFRPRNTSCRAEKSFAQGSGLRHFLIQIAQQLAVQCARMAEIEPHPFRGVALDSIARRQRPLRRLFLHFVRQRVVIARIFVMQQASNCALELNGVRRHFFIRRG